MKVQQRNKEDKWPQIRMGQHAACCLDFNTENPHLLISGGRLKYQLPPKDIWILNLAAATWMEVIASYTVCRVGNFHGMLIFLIIFVVNLAVTQTSTHKMYGCHYTGIDQCVATTIHTSYLVQSDSDRYVQIMTH